MKLFWRRILVDDRRECAAARYHRRSTRQVQEPHERPDGSVQWRPDRRSPAASGE